MSPNALFGTSPAQEQLSLDTAGCQPPPTAQPGDLASLLVARGAGPGEGSVSRRPAWAPTPRGQPPPDPAFPSSLTPQAPLPGDPVFLVLVPLFCPLAASQSYSGSGVSLSAEPVPGASRCGGGVSISPLPTLPPAPAPRSFSSLLVFLVVPVGTLVTWKGSISGSIDFGPSLQLPGLRRNQHVPRVPAGA